MNRKKLNLLVCFLLTVIVIIFTQCAPAHVQRVSESSVTDLSGRWNETDSRITAEKISEDMLNASWYNAFSAQSSGKKPKVIVGMIINKSHEHIASETFEKDIEAAMINSNRIVVVQSGGMREEMRAEQADQQNYATSETIKNFGLEHGADFMLQGTINSIVDEYSSEKSIYYQIDLFLTNIKTKEEVWIGQKKIKKYLGNKKKKLIDL